MIRVRRSPDARSFLAEAGPFLTEREAEHNLLLGISSSLLRDPSPFGQGPAYFAIVVDDDRVIGAALRTPPTTSCCRPTTRRRSDRSFSTPTTR